MTSHRELVEAAIKFDEETLLKSDDTGAAHFAGVLRLDPRHLGDSSNRPDFLSNAVDVDQSSLLFMAAEAIKNVLDGKQDAAIAILADLRPSGSLEHILVLLVQAWLPIGSTSFEEIAAFVQRASIDADLKARVYLKLMTWELEAEGKGHRAGTYYDRALEAASPSLQEAIYSVGESFGRETRYYYREQQVSEELVLYSWIVDSVSHAAADEFVRMARKRMSPFTRTMGGDPRTVPVKIRAAEIQAGWAGAYWVLEKIWRIKASMILVNSRDRNERADAITSWILSRGSSLRRLIDENESALNSNLISKILIDDLKTGARVGINDWIQICLALWDELPTEVSDHLIETLEIPAWSSETSAPVRETDAIHLFALLSYIDQHKWIERYESLEPAERLTVCLGLSTRQATELPSQLRNEIRFNLLNYCENQGQNARDHEMLETLAALVSELPEEDPDNIRFREVMPARYAGEIGSRYPRLATAEKVREGFDSAVSSIRQQLSQNRQGQWSTYVSSPALEAARYMMTMGSVDEAAVETLIEFATADFTASSDVIDAVNALSWLADAGLVDSAAITESRLPYRVNVSPVDRMWTGRDDIRAINATIAGLHARNLDTSRAAIARLVSAARDPDMEVRLLAIGQFDSSNLVVEGLQSAVDAAILGAVYDPDWRVQASAVRAIPSISDLLVSEIAWSRLISVWDSAHRRVRIAAASTASRQQDIPKMLEALRREVLRLASEDRSFQVRRATEAHE